MAITTAQRTSIIELYTAYFNRAADASGLSYWADKMSTDGWTIDQIASSFADQAEYKTEYPSYLTSEEVVTKIYSNVLGRTPDSEGLSYWSAELNDGKLTTNNMIQAVVTAAKANTEEGNTDAAMVANKTTVSEYYAVTLQLDDTTSATNIMATVTADAASVTTATTSLDTTAVAGTTMTLTTTADATTDFVGASKNDTFNGTYDLATPTNSTVGTGDVLNGGAGTDTLTIVASDDSGAAARTVSGVTTTDIEVLSITNLDADAVGAVFTVNAASMTGLTTVKSVNSVALGDVAVSNLKNIVDADMSGAADLTLSYNASILTGLEDAQTLTLNGQTAGTYVSLGAIETLNIVSSTSENTVAIKDDAAATIKTMNISGNQDLTLTEGAGDANDAVTTIDASALTGDLTVTTGSATSDITVTGGSGDDIITLSGNTFSLNDTIDGGAGEDTLSINTAITSIAALAGVSNIETLKSSVAITLAEDTTMSKFNMAGGATDDLTLNTGYTQATEVTLADDADVINSANVALTVNINAEDLEGTDTATITGGTGTDILNVTPTTDGENVTLSGTASATAVDVVNVVDFGDTTTADAVTGAIKGNDITITTGAYATDVTIDGSSLDTGATDTDTVADGTGDETDAEQLTVVGTNATGVLTVIGGEANDTITTGTANDIVTAGAGNDAITSTAGNDTIDAGTGDDTITMGSSLTASDTIDGGEGDDTLEVTSISAAALAGVTNVETLAVTGASTVSLSENLSFTSIDASDSATQSITFADGYTSATTVNLVTDAGDTVINNAGIAMTIDATKAAAITSTTITGKSTTTNDTIIVSAGDGTASDSTASTSTGNFGSVTYVDTITVRAGNDTGDDINLALGAYATNVTIDASALTDAGTLNTAGTATNGDDSTLTVVSSGSGTLTITSGAGWDDITVGTGIDTLSLGAGNDTVQIGNGDLTYQDTIDGGEGTDTLEIDTTTAITDVDFMNTSNVENITIVTDVTADITLSTYASAAGITKVTTVAGDGNDVVNAAGMTTSIEIVGSTATNGDDTLTGGTADDTFTFSGLVGLEDSDKVVGGTGTDTISLDNSAGAMTAGVNTTNGIVVSDTAAAATVSGVEKFVVKDADGGDTAGSEDADAVTLNFKDTSSAAAYNTIVDGSVITDSNDIFTVDASAVTDANFYTTFSITGGAAADVLSGGNGADTIDGGAGADTIDGGVGADTLTGGAGADTFVYVSSDSAGSKVDTITDFEATSDNLSITVTGDLNWDLTDKGDVTANNDGLGLLSSTATAGEYFFNTTTNQFVQDTDGNGLIQSSDTAITLTGETGFAAADVNFTIATAITGTNTITSGDGDLTMTVAATTTGAITTGAGNDTILSTTGVQTVNVGAGTNTINTGVGADVVTLGAGVDTLTIEVDADSKTGGIDHIKNFTTGTDKLVFIGTESQADDFNLALSMVAGALVDDEGAEASLNINLDSDTSGTASTIALTDYTFGTSSTALTMATSSTLIGSSNADYVVGGATDATVTLGLGADDFTSNGDDTVILAGGHSDFTTGIDLYDNLVLNAAVNDTFQITSLIGTETIEASQATGIASTALTATTLNALINSTDGTLTNNLDGDATNTQALILTTTDSKTYLAFDIDADGVFADGTDVIVEITGSTLTSMTDAIFA